MNKCSVYRLGVVEYSKAYQIQHELVKKKLNESLQDVLLLLEHPPTITLGKSGKIENIVVEKTVLEKHNIALHFVDRGGDVTYHGPGQLVGYPIIDIEEENLTFHDYIHNLEQTIIDTLSVFGLKAYRKENYRGVWTDSGKIASIGIRIVKKITMHGFALNVNPNLNHFNFIIPCGLSNEHMTSIFEITQNRIPLDSIMDVYEENFSKIFKYELDYGTLLA
ncbi:MAG: lipoyl(octanoyl) transferase LipB [Desulfurella sp.]|uniref:lipoyl(octanoyl) transferase LipB n=1 Tax=Desulfurella sp. TaxID=1962857 RepID=UPI0003E0A07A|nr:lipoyltransferase [Desulfurella acetivorans A63]